MKKCFFIIVLLIPFVLLSQRNTFRSSSTATADSNWVSCATDTIKARSASGLHIVDDSGTSGIFVEDGGQVGIGMTPGKSLDVNGTTRSTYIMAHGINLLNTTGLYSLAGVPINLITLSTDNIVFKANNTTEMTIASGGNIGISTDTFDGTAVGVLAIANGTAPGAGTADQSYIYAKDVSSSSEMCVMDEAGNETQISPHDPNSGKWIYFSKNVKTGRVLRIEMEDLIFDLAKEMSKKTGKNYIFESKKLK